MKDLLLNCKIMPKETIYKDVVIIGNGPSGISLSYMLSGHWPYWIPEKINGHQDELLRARLNYSDSGKSLVMQDLVTLADGLEGRSLNPISLLLDSLQNPNADLGMELPSMLEYKYHPNKQIDHVVLGKGPPGGSWHRMDPNLRTLSLSAWMSLPGFDYYTWQSQNPVPCKDLLSNKKCTNNNNNNVGLRQLEKSNHINNNFSNNCNSTTNDKNAKDLKTIMICKKCTELQEKHFQQYSSKHQTNTNNNNNNNKQQSIFSHNKTIMNNCESNHYFNSNSHDDLEIESQCCKCNQKIINIIDTSTVTNGNYKNDDKLNELSTSSSSNTSLKTPVAEVTTEVTTETTTTTTTPIVPRRNLSLNRLISKEVQTRALVSRVADYYESYVHEMGLNKYFVNDTIVTAIIPLQSKENRFKNARWIVSGINKSTCKAFSYACKNVVLANGASDLANRLGLQGENLGLPWVKHELPDLENALEQLSETERKNLKPVLIVGAGLSAADAVTICRSSNVQVIHVYRNRTAGLDKMLPENVYPEYHEVHKMMKDSMNTYELYTPLPEHTIVELSQASTPAVNNNNNHKVIVKHLITGEMKHLEISYCAILIGASPDLRFISSKIINYSTSSSSSSMLSPTTFKFDVDSPLLQLTRCNATDTNNNNNNNNNNNTKLQTFEDSIEQWSLLNRKLSWLKNICAKCKHLNLCEWSRRHNNSNNNVNNNNNNNNTTNDNRKFCGHNYLKSCECHRLQHKQRDRIHQQLSQSLTTTSLLPDYNSNPNNNNNNINSNNNYIEEIDSGLALGIGEDPKKPVDCKSNPIAVNKYTNHVLRVPQGLYAMGPLVGDNFVRFISGGALAITSALHKEND